MMDFWNAEKKMQDFENIGGPGEIRTHDLFHAMEEKASREPLACRKHQRLSFSTEGTDLAQPGTGTTPVLDRHREVAHVDR
jgi:hypothetical protein